MTKLQSIIFASDIVNNSATASAGSQMTIQNPLTTIDMKYVPGFFSFAVMVSFNEISDLGETQEFQMRVLSPSKEDVVFDTGLVDMPKEVFEDLSNPEGGQSSIQITFDIKNVEFREVGLYTFEIHFGNDVFDSHTIEVIKSQTPPLN